jgi:hypothetical protein
MLPALNEIQFDLQLKVGMKKGPLEVMKEQNHCTKVAYAGINWGLSQTE